MFYNPASRDFPGSTGLLQPRRIYAGNFNALSSAARNYLYSAGAGGGGPFYPPPLGTMAGFAVDLPQNANSGTVMGVSEVSAAGTHAQGLRPAGIYGLGIGTPPAGVNVGTVRGGDFDAVFNGAGSATQVVGGFYYAEVNVGTVTTAAGLKTVGPYKNSGTLTNSYGIWIGAQGAGGGSANVGLQVDSVGGSNNFAIRTSGADPISLGGDLQLTGNLIKGGTSVVSIDNASSAMQLQTGATVWGLSHICSSANNNGPGFAFAKNRGANATSHTIAQAGDVSGFIFFYASDGVTYQESSGFKGVVEGTPGVNTVPGGISFQAVAQGQQFLSEIMRMDSSGRFGIGVTPSHYLDIKAGTTTIAQMRQASSTLLTTAAAGCSEFDGKVFYSTSVASARQVVNTEQFQVLTSSRTFTNNTSAQAIFNATANGAVTLAGSTTYEFELFVAATGFSSSAHTINLGFAGTATFTAIGYFFEAQTGSTLATPTADLSGFIATNAATAVIASSTTTGLVLKCRGFMQINAGGTVIPQLTQVTASAAAVVQPNSFFRCWPVGSNTVTNVGNWS